MLKRNMMTVGASLLAITAGLACAPHAFAQAAVTAPAAQAPTDAAKPATGDQATPANEVTSVEEVVVTGVLGPRSIEKAPVSITAVTQEQIAQQAPASSADLLKTVPGVFVNSALGEVRNVVFSRGVSANSLDADSGYYYVSLQEDGMPIEPILDGNFGPDYFSRPDITLGHLEALRGGTAAITGPNAPGGIFNNISKTGKSDPGTQVSSKLGLEGDGHNPYYRFDAYQGGEIAPGLYYAIGGFYRHSVGARDPGYAQNRGGQIRGNLRWDYDQGSLLLTAKYLNDRNGYDEFIPAHGFDDPKLSAPYTNLTSVGPGSLDHPYVTATGQAAVFNPKNVIHSRALSLGLDWNHEFNDKFQIENKIRVSRNGTDWGLAGAISASPLTDFGTWFFEGTLGVPGQYTLSLPGGGVGATVNSATGFDFTVANNTLPGQDILANGVLSVLGFTYHFRSRNFQDNFTLRANLGNHHLAVGAYVQLGELKQGPSSIIGYALMTLQPNPQFLNVTFTTPAAPGATFQVTGPGGLTNYGFGAGGYTGKQDTVALFAGDSWQITDRMNFEGGLRYESIRYNILNAQVTRPASQFGGAGADGNPLTLYDNSLPTFGAPLRVKRDFDYLNLSGSLAYQVSDTFNAYVRYTQSKKSPSFQIIRSLNTPQAIETQFPSPQRIQQVEVGLKYNHNGTSAQLYPFYSKLSNVADLQTFVDDTGVYYSPPANYGTVETFGVEIQTNSNPTDWLNIYSALTLQKPKSKGFSTYLQNLPPRADDQLVTIPSGDADNNPKIIARTTVTVKPRQGLSVFATYSYLGKRAANRFNAFYLPDYSTVDIGAAYDVTQNFRLQANVNNLFNNYGILSWSRSGSVLASFDRQGLRPQDVAAAGPNGLIQVVPSPSRAFFLTGTLKF